MMAEIFAIFVEMNAKYMHYLNNEVNGELILHFSFRKGAVGRLRRIGFLLFIWIFQTISYQ